MRRFRFYAGLLDTLTSAEEQLLGRYRGEGSVEQLDKRRLGLYYATDWILQREQQEFTLDDLVKASQRMSRLITPVEEAAPGELQRLLDVLLHGEYIEAAKVPAPGTVSSPASRVEAEGPVRYRCALGAGCSNWARSLACSNRKRRSSSRARHLFHHQG